MKITNIDTLGISTFVFTHKKTTLYKITTEIYKSQKHFFYLNPILKTTLCIRVNHYAKRDYHYAKRDYLCKGVSLKMFSLLTLSNPVRDISCFTTSTFPL